MPPTSTTKYQGETKFSPPVRFAGGGVNINFQLLVSKDGPVVLWALDKVRNSSMTVIWFTMHLNSTLFVQ